MNSPRGQATILSIQVGMPKSYLHGDESSWESGIVKYATAEPVMASANGIVGDGQSDLRFHGGPDRAILVFAKPNYAEFEAILGREIPHGGFGENITADGLPEVDIGDIWTLGTAKIEISQPRLPCFKLGRRLENDDIVSSVMDARKGGWYARVIEDGFIQGGDAITLIDRPHPTWTIHRTFDVFLANSPDRAELAQLPALSQLWRDRFDRLARSE